MSKQLSTEWHKMCHDILQLHVNGQPEVGWQKLFDGNPFASSFKVKLRYEDKIYKLPYRLRIDRKEETVEVFVPLTKEQDELNRLIRANRYKNHDYDFPLHKYDANKFNLTYDQIVNDVEFALVNIGNFNKYIDDFKVGCFAKFSGQRDKKSWRKILSIDWQFQTAHGHKYSAPVDDVKFDERHSSVNSISTLIEVHTND